MNNIDFVDLHVHSQPIPFWMDTLTRMRLLKRQLRLDALPSL